MKDFYSLEEPEECQLLISFIDLTNFGKFSRRHTNQSLFNFLSEYFEYVGDLIEGSGGKVVNCMGDAALIVYREEKINEGVLALKRLKDEGDQWLAAKGAPCRNVVKVHFGSMICGPIGTRSEKRFDVIGTAANTAALLQTNGFAITPQVFRKLDKDVRKLFKKHTPPITYIPAEARHEA